MSAYQFDIHGVVVNLETSSRLIAEPVETLLRYFPQVSPLKEPDVRLTFQAVPRRQDIPISPSPSAERLREWRGQTMGDELRSVWECDFIRDQDGIIFDFHEQGLQRISLLENVAEGYLVAPEAMHPNTRVTFIHLAMTELLKKKGLSTLHATALEKNGRGVLIPGYSGRGKTTSFLSLLRAGYHYLSDDHPFVRENENGLEVLPFPVKVDVTDNTVKFFPELQQANGLLQQGVHKKFFYVEDIYPGPLGSACPPHILLFPFVLDCPKSYLEPLSKSRALEELLPQGMFIYDKGLAKREIQTLTKVVESAACYRLYFGEDVLNLPALIDPLIENIS